MRVVFAGTPRAAVPSLEAILGSRHEVAAVVTYIRASWGNGGAAVSATEANKLRTAPLD